MIAPACGASGATTNYLLASVGSVADVQAKRILIFGVIGACPYTMREK